MVYDHVISFSLAFCIALMLTIFFPNNFWFFIKFFSKCFWFLSQVFVLFLFFSANVEVYWFFFVLSCWSFFFYLNCLTLLVSKFRFFYILFCISLSVCFWFYLFFFSQTSGFDRFRIFLGNKHIEEIINFTWNVKLNFFGNKLKVNLNNLNFLTKCLLKYFKIFKVILSEFIIRNHRK